MKQGETNGCQILLYGLSTHYSYANPGRRADLLRDIQTSNNNRDTLIRWSFLRADQRIKFLKVLFNARRYLDSEQILHFLIYREGKFNLSQTAMIPEETAHSLQSEMTTWIEQQLKIYPNSLSEL